MYICGHHNTKKWWIWPNELSRRLSAIRKHLASLPDPILGWKALEKSAGHLSFQHHARKQVLKSPAYQRSQVDEDGHMTSSLRQQQQQLPGGYRAG